MSRINSKPKSAMLASSLVMAGSPRSRIWLAHRAPGEPPVAPARFAFAQARGCRPTGCADYLSLPNIINCTYGQRHDAQTYRSGSRLRAEQAPEMPSEACQCSPKLALRLKALPTLRILLAIALS